MDFKYKIADVAKEFGVPAKKVIETVAPITGETYKTGGTFGERELDFLLEKLTRENAETSLDAYLASGVKAEEKKPEPKKAEPRKQEAKKEPRRDSRKPEKPAEKRSEKRVTLQELAANTGIKKPVAATEQVQVNRAQVSVDTRTVDVNVDKFNARYDDLADSRNMPGKRKKAPTGKKEKFNNRNNRRGQQFGRRRETEAERLQRIQLEKARNAQLKISIPDEITVGELASRLKQTAAKVVAKFMQMGEMHAVSDVVDFDTAALIAEEFHAKVEHEVHVSIEERLFVQEEDNEADLVARPPVVVVMGHVDHGKTSILDAIRKTNVTAGEAGGITQAIGAYQVATGSGDVITFLDTPGHEAFTAMRARGANMTDIAVLVVAADDGIMPQTIESINHAKAAGVKLIVAINKMDKPTANPERVKEQLTQYEIVPEDWGGEVACLPVSALTGMGIQDLLERIVLEAEVMELKANPNRRGKGAVVEARLDKGQGPVATLLVQNGTLHKGDCLIAGTAVGRVRTMRDDKGREITEAGPSTPVEITGLTEVPEAGELFEAVEDEKLARELADKRTTEAKERQFAAYTKVTLDNLFDQMAANDMKELPIVVKADVQGSAEAVKQSLEKISNDEVRVRVIHAGVGAISKSDVSLADASNAIIIGFNVRPDAIAKAEAEQTGVEMRMYRVIYDAINDVSDAMKGMLAPKIREVALGEAQVRQVYKISSVGTVAGCRVTSGKITRDAQLRLVRDGIVICEDAIASLKRFKDDAKEVAEGFECGITLQKFSDIKEGDVFECFKLEEYRD
ncbi:MAG TPA: translation initiation factor IF-2 [Candidatus Gemmiger avistercoris]|uniref:Translation initiation factor IF-2 n=1 Tax=Candidatus Gemmiger avistercoris TaxID=2838606 RepID=A0A9D2FJM2_9FIRM|nr:translation initiation factor IF-2 [uncultured Subdoligranulum sp.]HIZ62028.1 translation initiation factor IF-2 [Candidatus Gemmiger avistercoris]